jgi:magnesium transporter
MQFARKWNRTLRLKASAEGDCLGLTRGSHNSKLDYLREEWGILSREERRTAFNKMPQREAEEIFLTIRSKEQAELILGLPIDQRGSWLRLLDPDDAADLIQEFPQKKQAELLSLLEGDAKQEVIALMAYAENQAGGLMNPRFVRLKPETPVEVAVRYLRTQARRQVETIHYSYVVGPDDTLLGAVSFRDLLLARPKLLVHEIMAEKLITVPEQMNQEDVSRKFSRYGLTAIPVVDVKNRIKGIVTVDDVTHVMEEETTEDIQRFGGMAALDAPYFQISFVQMIKKRAGWLSLLFLGEMFTATAMGFYQSEIERAVVLALFIPLVISSGGNSGSQASTLIIRAMALGEIRLRDWWRVLLRETSSGVVLGGILGVIGLLRILIWPASQSLYGDHYVLIGSSVACSLVGIVLWGTVSGSMLPFILKRLGLDPATASAPAVATLVDVTGIVIYFTVAGLILGGVVL